MLDQMAGTRRPRGDCAAMPHCLRLYEFLKPRVAARCRLQTQTFEFAAPGHDFAGTLALSPLFFEWNV